MSYIPKDAVTQSFKSNKGVLTPNQIIELDNENKFTKYGQLELIQTQTASSVSTLDFTSIQENTYNVHFLTVNNYQADTDNKIFTIQLFENGVVETASVYQIAIQGGRANGTFSEYKSTSFSSGVMSVGSGIDNASDSSANSYIYFYNLGDSTSFSASTYHIVYNYYDGAVFEMNYGSGVLPQASTVDGMRILTNGGTFSGDFSLYGIRSY
tara:strand:+ start:503 stop:1135 length:633 start_codon:yes stop_codon:yes gene_type:complete